ncbi:hypothetical protein [Dietzia psychralcaliphila]|uniref:Uncharacterized protein n=1 Tax=Dietzia psychralcaliphila TaxID=139021 RepID=A0AAD0NQ22_9ACTN|nr:hypothetical protein [Dietzia psychralcaliphila]AWH94573.1 hypothetical protein A6048_02590 [Dietzia psychralcaliphila]PTM86147.1 hypothetical protein C8N39_108103 [Dietzia psychralcaliphila]
MTGRPDHDAEVRGEAARLVHRLELARTRLDAALDPRDPTPAPGSPPPPPRAPAGGVATGPGLDDDEVRTLLAPAVARVARLHEIARSLADGSASEESAAQAVRALADTQPNRRPR